MSVRSDFKRVETVRGTIQGLISTRSTFQKMKSLFEQSRGKFKTGALEPFKVKVAALAEAFDLKINITGLGAAQAFDALSSELALRLRNPDSGLGLTGNTSNRDLAFLRAAVMGLGKTKLANEILMNLSIAALDRQIEVAEATEEYFNSNNKSLDGVRGHLKEKFGETQLVFDETVKTTIHKSIGEEKRSEWKKRTGEEMTDQDAFEQLTKENSKQSQKERLTGEDFKRVLKAQGFDLSKMRRIE